MKGCMMDTRGTRSITRDMQSTRGHMKGYKMLSSPSPNQGLEKDSSRVIAMVWARLLMMHAFSNIWSRFMNF